MKSLSPTSIRMMIFAVALCVVGAGSYGGIWYLLRMSEAKVETYAAQHAQAEAKRSEITALERLYAETQLDRVALRTFVIEKDGVADFLELIEGIARRHGLEPTTRSLAVEEVPHFPEFEALALTLEVGGAYEHIVTMLPIIEALPYQAEIRSVSLERSGTSETGDDLWRGVFMLRVSKEK